MVFVVCVYHEGKSLHGSEDVIRLTIRSSYGAGLMAASHGYNDAFPTLVIPIELKYGILSAEELKGYRENGGIRLKIILTIDTESVFKSLTSRDLKTPAEKTLMGHVVWLRELLKLGFIQKVQSCDARDMSADGHTKGSIERQGLVDLMQGIHEFPHEVKDYIPHR